MAIPDYQTLMLPLLRLLGDGQSHQIRELYEILAGEFNLSDEERSELLPSGRQGIFANRVGWARTYMGKAGLLETVSRGTVRITPLGREVLDTRPSRIDRSYLMRFESFRVFQQPAPHRITASIQSVRTSAEADTACDPSERLNLAYREIREALGADLLDQVRQATPHFFERLVIDLLVAMGYGGSRDDAGLAVGRSGDGGIDGIIKEDRLGLDVVYIQAKRWENPVGRPIVQAFAGSLDGERARKGVLITTSRFTPDAQEYVRRIEKRIVLIDGEQLATYMIDFGIGVTDVTTLQIRRIDQDYFES